MAILHNIYCGKKYSIEPEKCPQKWVKTKHRQEKREIDKSKQFFLNIITKTTAAFNEQEKERGRASKRKSENNHKK